MAASGQADPDGAQESPGARIRRLVAEGKISAEEVEAAERLWRERLRGGVKMPNGELVSITLDDVRHLIVDHRIARHPERIERLLHNVFEIRTAPLQRRLILSRWFESGQEVIGYGILTPEGGVRSMHIVDQRRLRRLMRSGDLLWKR